MCPSGRAQAQTWDGWSYTVCGSKQTGLAPWPAGYHILGFLILNVTKDHRLEARCEHRGTSLCQPLPL